MVTRLYVVEQMNDLEELCISTHFDDFDENNPAFTFVYKKKDNFNFTLTRRILFFSRE